MKVKNLKIQVVPSYYCFCFVLHIWHIRAIPTYRVYQLYDTPGSLMHKDA